MGAVGVGVNDGVVETGDCVGVGVIVGVIVGERVGVAVGVGVVSGGC
jgi:hypothetical protein